MINIHLDKRAEYYEGVRRVSDWAARGGILLAVSFRRAREITHC